MSHNTAAQITTDQLRNREIVVADLLQASATKPGDHRTIITAPSEPMSVFGRKLAGHES
jgi:hypothetical protein